MIFSIIFRWKGIEWKAPHHMPDSAHRLGSSRIVRLTVTIRCQRSKKRSGSTGLECSRGSSSRQPEGDNLLSSCLEGLGSKLFWSTYKSPANRMVFSLSDTDQYGFAVLPNLHSPPPQNLPLCPARHRVLVPVGTRCCIHSFRRNPPTGPRRLCYLGAPLWRTRAFHFLNGEWYIFRRFCPGTRTEKCTGCYSL